MRANRKLQRLFVSASLSKGAEIELSREQAHYLLTVLRMRAGERLLVFNGRDGEWMAEIADAARKAATLRAESRTREQTPAPDLVYCFAPLKSARLDYVVQKAVEMGAGLLQPVMTHHTQVSKIQTDRMRANALEAAEQCRALSVPQVREPLKLEALLAGWQRGRRLIVCDEMAAETGPLPILGTIGDDALGVLVGPEGGFSEEERTQLLAAPFVTSIPLGPRILRADTAAVAALAVIQAAIGDWR